MHFPWFFGVKLLGSLTVLTKPFSLGRQKHFNFFIRCIRCSFCKLDFLKILNYLFVTMVYLVLKLCLAGTFTYFKIKAENRKEKEMINTVNVRNPNVQIQALFEIVRAQIVWILDVWSVDLASILFVQFTRLDHFR